MGHLFGLSRDRSRREGAPFTAKPSVGQIPKPVEKDEGRCGRSALDFAVRDFSLRTDRPDGRARLYTQRQLAGVSLDYPLFPVIAQGASRTWDAAFRPDGGCELDDRKPT